MLPILRNRRTTSLLYVHNTLLHINSCAKLSSRLRRVCALSKKTGKLVEEDAKQANRDKQRQQLGEELRRLQEQHQSSEGKQIISRINAFAGSYHVFMRNHEELRGFLDHIAKNDMWPHIWDERHRYRLEYARLEVTRLLHNYVAAVFSLVDATRAFVLEHYKDIEVLEEYESRKDRDFKEAPLHRFLQDLRNYTTHRRLPPIRPTVSFKKRDDGAHNFDSTFKLNVHKLREWDGWKGKARDYLDTLGSEVRLSDVIDAYEPVVTAFHEWLGERMGKEHAEDIKDLLALENRMKEVERKWRAAWETDRSVQEQEVTKKKRVRAEQPSLETDASEFATVDEVITTLYKTISFRVGEVPDLGRLRSLFMPKAQLVQEEPDGSPLMDTETYISDFRRMLGEGVLKGISSVETARRNNEFGNVAHVFSAFKSRLVEGDHIRSTHGVNSFHLVRDGGRWCIISRHWKVESDEKPSS